MRFHQIFPAIAISGLCAILSLCAAGAAFASPDLRRERRTRTVTRLSARRVLDTNEAPIVSGRSASAHHRSKMHHVHMNLDQLRRRPLADEATPSGE